MANKVVVYLRSLNPRVLIAILAAVLLIFLLSLGLGIRKIINMRNNRQTANQPVATHQEQPKPETTKPKETTPEEKNIPHVSIKVEEETTPPSAIQEGKSGQIPSGTTYAPAPTRTTVTQRPVTRRIVRRYRIITTYYYITQESPCQVTSSAQASAGSAYAEAHTCN